MSKVIVHMKDTDSQEIHNIHCPESEIFILDILGDKEMTAPQISRASDGKVSISSVCRFLRRLSERGLVAKKDAEFPVADIVLKRVAYSTTFDKRF